MNLIETYENIILGVHPSAHSSVCTCLECLREFKAFQEIEFFNFAVTFANPLYSMENLLRTIKVRVKDKYEI